MPSLVFAGEGFFEPEDGAIHSFTLADGALTPGPVTANVEAVGAMELNASGRKH